MLHCLPSRNRELANTDDRAHGTYQVEVDRVTETQWSEWMDRFEDANIYQTWAYGAVRWRENNLSHLVLKRGSEVVGMAQLRIIRPGNLPIGVAYLRWGPLCHLSGTELDPEAVRAMAIALREEYVVKRSLYLEILPNAFSDTARAEAFQSAFWGFDEKPGISDGGYRTLLLDLTPPLDELRKKLDKKWRNQLNAAERNSLEVLEGGDCEDYSAFSTLYAQMRQRKNFDSGVSIDEFLRVQERLPKQQRLRTLTCRYAGKLVAGAVCSAIGGSAIYLLGATNEDGMKVKGSYLLQWATIRMLKERGTRCYDLGGIDPAANPGVHHFKTGLSGVDMSHMSPLIACDNQVSTVLVKVGKALQARFRGVRRRASARTAKTTQ